MLFRSLDSLISTVAPKNHDPSTSRLQQRTGPTTGLFHDRLPYLRSLKLLQTRNSLLRIRITLSRRRPLIPVLRLPRHNRRNNPVLFHRLILSHSGTKQLTNHINRCSTRLLGVRQLISQIHRRLRLTRPIGPNPSSLGIRGNLNQVGCLLSILTMGMSLGTIFHSLVKRLVNQGEVGHGNLFNRFVPISGNMHITTGRRLSSRHPPRVSKYRVDIQQIIR